MTRIREPRHVAHLRRTARDINDGTSYNSRLDAIARANDHGTWSALVKAYSPKPGEDVPYNGEPRPFPNLHYISFEEGGILARLENGTALRLHPGASASLLLGDVDMSRRIAASAIVTDDSSTFVIHGDGDLMRQTSLHRSTISNAMIAGSSGRHGCRIEPLTRPWMPERSEAARTHVRSMLTCLSGFDGPDAEAHHDMVDCALSLVSQSGEVTIEAVLHETTRRHGLEPWSATDIAATTTGRILTPKDLDDTRPATIYFGRTADPTSRRDRIARTVQVAISHKRSGNLHHSYQRGVVVVYDGPRTWVDQPTLLTVGDIGRSKQIGQILCGGTRAEFEEANDPLGLAIYDSVTPVVMSDDDGVLRIGIYRHDAVAVAPEWAR